MIRLENLIVLYGKSGLGKTSLLNAGVLPEISKEEEYLIIRIRFGSYSDLSQAHYSPLTPHRCILQALQKFELDRSFIEALSLEDEATNLWLHAKNLQLCNPNIEGILFVIDQFEELFSWEEQEINAFKLALADLLYIQIPQKISKRISQLIRTHPNLYTAEQLERMYQSINAKVLIAIRSDRFSQLNDLSDALPNIMKKCYHLDALSVFQAKEAILLPAQQEGEFDTSQFSFSPEALDQILNYLSNSRKRKIESFQLQLLCQEIEDKVRVHRNIYIKSQDLGDFEKIYENYYDRQLNSIENEEDGKKARKFIEEGLVFEDEERRLSVFEGIARQQYQLSLEVLTQLVEMRLIRAEPLSDGGFSYELIHDTLVHPVIKAKNQRIRQEGVNIEKKRINRIRRRIGIISMLASAIMLILIGGIIYTNQQKNEVEVAKEKAEKLSQTLTNTLIQLKEKDIRDLNHQIETYLAISDNTTGEQRASYKERVSVLRTRMDSIQKETIWLRQNLVLMDE